MDVDTSKWELRVTRCNCDSHEARFVYYYGRDEAYPKYVRCEKCPGTFTFDLENSDPLGVQP